MWSQQRIGPRAGVCRSQGFTLLELLFALSVGLLLSGLAMQALLGGVQGTQRMSQLLRERTHQRRALELIRSDLKRATAVVANDQAPLPVSCGLNGRRVVLQLRTATATGEGTVTYSVGAAPSGIWEGRVLVRCGPAYGLDGDVSPMAAFQSRVLLDRLASSPTTWTGCAGLPGAQVLNDSASLAFSACLAQGGQLVALRLQQSLTVRIGHEQRLSREAAVGLG